MEVALNQLNKINELLREKEIVDLLPKQKVFAYQSFILLKSNKEKDLIALYEKELKNMAKPIAKELLFNKSALQHSNCLQEIVKTEQKK